MLFFNLGVFFFHNGIFRNLPAKLITFDARNTIESSIVTILGLWKMCLAGWSRFSLCDDWTLLKCRQRWMLAVFPEYGGQALKHNTCPISTRVLLEPSFSSLSLHTTDLAGCSSSKQNANTYKSFRLKRWRTSKSWHSRAQPKAWIPLGSSLEEIKANSPRASVGSGAGLWGLRTWTWSELALN